MAFHVSSLSQKVGFEAARPVNGERHGWARHRVASASWEFVHLAQELRIDEKNEFIYIYNHIQSYTYIIYITYIYNII